MFYWVPIDWKVWLVGGFVKDITHEKKTGSYAQTIIIVHALCDWNKPIECTCISLEFPLVAECRDKKIEKKCSREKEKEKWRTDDDGWDIRCLCRVNLANKQQQRQRWIDWSGFFYIDCAFTCCCSIKWIMIIFMMLVNFTVFFQSLIFIRHALRLFVRLLFQYLCML